MNLTVSDGFPYYISLTAGQDLRQIFSSEENFDFLASLAPAQAAQRYAPGKWSIRQIVGHMTDHERIMSYRALRFSRNDKTQLPGYDQDVLVNNSRFDELDFRYLLDDFKTVRRSTISFMQSLSDQQFQLKGLAWKFELTVEEALRATIGHEFHHMRVIRDKYLSR
jgi:uncharacterized damage-inducible protein DinB